MKSFSASRANASKEKHDFSASASSSSNTSTEKQASSLNARHAFTLQENGNVQKHSSSSDERNAVSNEFSIANNDETGEDMVTEDSPGTSFSIANDAETGEDTVTAAIPDNSFSIANNAETEDVMGTQNVHYNGTKAETSVT